MTQPPDALSIAAAVRNGEMKAATVIESTLDQIAVQNAKLNCFTTVTAERAMATAEAIDQAVAQGDSPGLLAGVPFAVKNLFDIARVTTLAGAKLEQNSPPAATDATAIARLTQAGAILVGALNMDEYAYGFVTINRHYGHTPELSRMPGGSSGGPAAAVAAGLVPLTLGSDTNGSIRVPAALCGVYGLKPTYGRLSRAGAYLFVASLDHIGPFARSVADLAAAFDMLQGPDPRDPICTSRSPEITQPLLTRGIDGLKIAIAGDYFSRGMTAAVSAALSQVVAALGVHETVTIPEAARARAAAYLITASEGSNLHFKRLQQQPMDFDPATRDRFLAGALLPAAWYIQAQRFRRWYRDRVRELFQSVDILLAPAVPCVAPPLEQTELIIDGQRVPLRPNLGLYTQPLSFIGLPIVSVPVFQPHQLPVGIQVIAAPYQEAKALRVAAYLESQGITQAPVASPI